MKMDAESTWEQKDYPPCKLACPILTDVREYVQCIAERRFEDALVSIRRQNPLPRTCGRICTHPCETACKRGQVDEPIAIAALKRFAADGLWKDHYKEDPSAEPTGHNVAIIGSGPAGLTAAHDLALLGHHVTIFEILSVPGGMLRVGVPEYRLPKAVLDQEVQTIVDLGVEIKTEMRIGDDIKFSDLFNQGFKALFVAIGAHEDRKLGIAGEEDLEGVVSAVSYLRAVNQGQNPEVGTRVAVIGGGNTAIDSARSLVRLGAESVHVVYRRSMEEMPAAPEEIEEAIHEGVQMAYLTSPVEILGKDGKVSSLKCMKNALGEPDASGRRSPRPVPGSEFALDVDMVVAAIGQMPHSSLLARDIEFNEKGKVIHLADVETLTTTRSGIFAGGDAVTGPATAIKAIAAGKRAAVSIDAYLKGESALSIIPSEAVPTEQLSQTVVERTKNFPRHEAISLPVGDRVKSFDEVKSVLTEDLAVGEALRCLHCYLGATVDKEKCISCLNCVQACPVGAPTTTKMGEITIDRFSCQACGVCVLECPVQAIDIALEPRADVRGRVREALRNSDNSVVIGFFDYQGNFGPSHLKLLKDDYPSIVPIMVHGLRRVDTSDVFKAFELGADAVILAGCRLEADPYPAARENVYGRMADARAVLDVLGLDGRRLMVVDMPEQGLIEYERVEELMGLVSELGPNLLR
jgi:NADPH-dependent glutamate synthase beta subunit-like oxidoreductase/coenzyme F420-reducing hydrogenase delta subunit/Pyruvate/2-oxoacid:ferredoxin oxidoreductase delta subunit